MYLGSRTHVRETKSADQLARANVQGDLAPALGNTTLERIMQVQAVVHFREVANHQTYYSMEVPTSPDVTGTRIRHMSSALDGAARPALK